MSETEMHIGKLKEVEVQDIESFAKEVYESKFDYKLEDYWEDYTDWLIHDCDGYVIVNSKVFEIVNDESLDDLDIFQANESAGYIEYLVKYYNGGCGFNEAIRIALEKMEKEKNVL